MKALRRFVTLGMLVTFAFAVAQPVTVVTVDGVGAVRSDVGAARDEAVRDALRLAVEQALGVRVQGRTLMVDYQVVEDRVVGLAAGFVRAYDVVSERREDDLYRVTIRAEVDTELMIGDLEGFGALLRVTLGNPRILVVATSDGADDVAVANRLVDHFVARQFFVVSPDQVAALRRDGGPMSAAELADAARTVDADVVVYAMVSSDPTGARATPQNQIHSARASIALQAVLARTGQIIASRSAVATQASVSEALARDDAVAAATTDALGPFTLETVRVMNDTLGGEGTAQSFRVVVRGVQDFEVVLRLRTALSEVRGVQSLQQRRFGDGEATFDLQGSATTDDVALRLIDLEGLDVAVTYLDAQLLEVTVGP